MLLNKTQAFFIIWLLASLTGLGIILVLYLSLLIGPSTGMLAALIFVLASLSVCIIAIMHSAGLLETQRMTASRLSKSGLRSLLLRERDHPFSIKRGAHSDVSIVWKLPRPNDVEYRMDIWLDEKTRTCSYSEQIKGKTGIERLGPTTRSSSNVSEKGRSLLYPSIWPALTGGRDIDPAQTRRLVWDACTRSGWKVARR